MSVYQSEEFCANPSSLCDIYGDEEADNFYENVKRAEASLQHYDDIIETKSKKSDSMCSKHLGEKKSSIFFKNPFAKLLKRSLHEYTLYTWLAKTPSWIKLIGIALTAMAVTSSFFSIKKASCSPTTSNQDPFIFFTSSRWFVEIQSTMPRTCVQWGFYQTIRIQPLLLQERGCDGKSDCLELIAYYTNIASRSFRYAFFIDKSGNIYEGLNFWCQFVTAEMWVAVLAENFHSNSSVARALLNNFRSVLDYGRQSRLIYPDYEITYETMASV
ncbi:hypothetical protein J6590_053670 [Homalodisca vitripennis]|nr:hypothetical protein J6590_053670 [Homalodisca vitripennis]